MKDNTKIPQKLSFFMTFVKFSTGFAAIIAMSLFSLQVASAML